MPDDPQSTPYIEFKHVSKSFGDNRVLDDVSFDVRAGRDGLHSRAAAESANPFRCITSWDS